MALLSFHYQILWCRWRNSSNKYISNWFYVWHQLAIHSTDHWRCNSCSRHWAFCHAWYWRPCSSFILVYTPGTDDLGLALFWYTHLVLTTLFWLYFGVHTWYWQPCSGYVLVYTPGTDNLLALFWYTHLVRTTLLWLYFGVHTWYWRPCSSFIFVHTREVNATILPVQNPELWHLISCWLRCLEVCVSDVLQQALHVDTSVCGFDPFYSHRGVFI